MLEIPLTIVDLIALGILGISGLIAWYRGFLKETLTVSAWLLAAVAAVFLWPATKSFARALVQPKLFADIVALVGVFMILLIPTSFVSFRLSELVRESRAGPLDRSLGFVFGVARGLLVVGLGYLIFSSLAPAKDHPDWLRQARLLPVVKGTADMLSALGGKKKKADEEAAEEKAEPKPVQDVKKPEPKKTAKDQDTDTQEGGGDKSQAYGAGDRRALDQLVRSTSKP